MFEVSLVVSPRKADRSLYTSQILHSIQGIPRVKQTADKDAPYATRISSFMTLPDPDKLSIVYYPDPVLKRVCDPVESLGPELAAFAQGMLEVMHRLNGVGLAAPQVGVAIRLFVCNLTGEPEDDLVFVNPQLSDLDGALEHIEGCLSIPNVDVSMRRSLSAKLAALDTEGIAIMYEGEDLASCVWQHEMDHLNGRLIIDRMSTTDEIANRRAIKQLEADFAASPRPKGSSRCESSS